MKNYNPKSLKAEEFISDAEILDTLAYAEANKNNLPLIEEILEKARPKKTETGHVCAGLSHREASVLLACDIPEVIEKIYQIAEEIKQKAAKPGMIFNHRSRLKSCFPHTKGKKIRKFFK